MSSVCADSPAICQAKGYRSRELPPAEWHRLAGTELGPVVKLLTPNTRVLVVEDGDGAIVAHWTLIPVWHLEGLWIREDARKRTAVARRLWTGLKRLAASSGIPGVMTAAESDDVRALLAHVGAEKYPFETYTMRLEDETRCL